MQKEEGEKGKKSLLLLAAAVAALAVSQPAVTTKMPNGKTMNIYSKVSAKGPSKKVSSTKYFKTSKIQVSTQKGPKEVASTRSHSGSSAKWNARNHYGVETSSNSWTSGGLTLRTNLWEPRNLSLEGNGFQQVGPVMEGLAVNGGWAYSSWYVSAGATNVANPKGNIVAFNLSKINKYKAQYLSPRNYLYKYLSFKTFERYSQNLKISPYIKLGHGRSLGASGKYIYVLVNRNKLPGRKSNGFYSEEIL